MFAKQNITLLIILFSGNVFFFHCISALREQTAENEEELQQLLDKAKPGDVIQLLEKDYFGDFYIENSGNHYHKIVLKGAPPADNIKNTRLIGNKTALEIRANYWKFQNLNITAAEEGVYIEGANNTLESFAIYEVNQAITIQGDENTLGSISIHDVGGAILVKGSDNRIRDISINNSTSGVIVETGNRSRIHNIDLHNGLGVVLAFVLEEGTCCGRVTNTVFDGLVEIKGDQYNFRNTIANAAINILGCRNEFGRSVFGRTFFTKECGNKLVTSNVFHFPQDKPTTLKTL
ncbi:unnamed protein product [Orchesella dallaii]|uniref:Right handed beta helix domain-containing protein n=1 Tax=Orchesella dallaii TaxID=48710 RepID=A0ABP1PJU4_9HEXA